MPSLYAINTVHVSGQEKYLIVSQGEEGIAVAYGSGEGWAVFLPNGCGAIPSPLSWVVAAVTPVLSVYWREEQPISLRWCCAIHPFPSAPAV